MFPRLRFAWFCVLLGTAAFSGENEGASSAAVELTSLAVPWAPSRALAQGGPNKVYRLEDKHGRQVFTNAGNVAVDGHTASAVDLPTLGEADLKNVDLSGADQGQLALLDRTVQLAHDELQNGRRCAAIRASLRVPMRNFFWPDHLRELSVGGALALVALLVMFMWNGRLKSLMPLAPLIACGYLGYATYTQVDLRMDVLREGLRACSQDLPPSLGANAIAVKERLASASSLEAAVERAYAVRAPLVEGAR